VVAAGGATRFGAHKQFAVLGAKPVTAWSVSACRSVADAVVVVLPPGHLQDHFGADVAVAGGATRAASVRAGLAAVPGDTAVVVVHDAARPLAAPRLFADVVAALREPGVSGAICAVPVTDTLKRVHGDPTVVGETVERHGVVAVQTPQAFAAGVLRAAHAPGDDATDDAALVESLGATVRVVPGDPFNVKLTVPEDLVWAEHLLDEIG